MNRKKLLLIMLVMLLFAVFAPACVESGAQSSYASQEEVSRDITDIGSQVSDIGTILDDIDSSLG